MRRVRIEPSACLLGAVFVLVLPFQWLLGAVFAAVFHELCHWAAVRLCGGHIHTVSIGGGGAVMSASAMERWKAAFCAAAGPLGSLLLLLFVRWIPRTAVCAAVQGLYNLLPIYPLDGGRIARCFASESVCRMVQWVTLLLLGAVGVICSVYWNLGILPLLITLAAAVRALGIKTPCKEDKLAVQ